MFVINVQCVSILRFNSPTSSASSLQGRTQELTEGCCIDETLQGRIQELAIGAAPSLLPLPLPLPLLSPPFPSCPLLLSLFISLFPYLFLSPLTFPSIPLTSPGLRSRAPLTSEVGWGCYRQLQRVPGWSPGQKRIWCTLKLSESHWLQSF